MFSALNITLLSLHASQFSLFAPHSAHFTELRFSKLDIKYNYLNSFLFSTKQKHQTIYLGHSMFRKFLNPVLHIEKTLFNRDDITKRPTNVDLKALNVTVTESFFSNCAAVDGGAFFVVFDGKIIVDKSNFVNCSSQDKGGVLFFYGTSLSFTSSCFSYISAKSGFAIFCSRSKSLGTIENCHFFEASGEKLTVFLNGFDISLKFNNASNIDSTTTISSFGLIPQHSFIFEQISLVNNTGDSLLYFESIDEVDVLKSVNIIKCELRDSVFLLKSAIAKISLFSFQFEDITASYTLSKSSDSSTLFVANSHFSSSKDKIIVDAYVTFENNNKFSENSLIPLNFVETKICHSQNRFKFVEPALYKKVIVACVVVALFVAGFIYIIIEACKDDKEHKELLKVAEYNEQMNNEIRLDDLGNLAEKKKYQEELREHGKDGKGDISD